VIAVSREVLLVGSVPLADTEEVLRTTAPILGDRVTRLPDGETGYARGYWFQCQWPYFLMHPMLEMVEPDPAVPGMTRPARIPADGIYGATRATFMSGRARVRDGVDPAAVRFEDLGYADWGIASHAVFARLQDEGVISPSVRFQVCIPSTMVGGRMCEPETFASILAAYRDGLFGEIARLVEAIGADRLAIQWDCVEPAVYEPASPEVRESITETLVALGAGVRAGVELG
jgi:hypothetical protein